MNTLRTTSQNQTRKHVSVMLVDDSAVIRGALSKLVEADPDIKIVASASNGEMGISQARRHTPDVVLLDIEMPVMDGLTALPRILEASPESKVIMFSSLTEKGASHSMKALELGAVECIVKPSSSQDTGEGSDFQKTLIDKIKGLVGLPAFNVKRSARTSQDIDTQKSYSLLDDPKAYKGKPHIIAIGSSTGGPNALFEVIKNLKDINIPIVITQHMPATFTKMLAVHIESNTGLKTFEGENGMVLQPGTVYVAPGGFHMLLHKTAASEIVIELNDGPAENYCKPAVDPMFRSLVDVYGNKVLGVILTGMGNDGLNGSKLLTENGARVIAQDQKTSVVWGMPGAVATAGICSEVLPIQDIGPWVKNVVMG